MPRNRALFLYKSPLEVNQSFCIMPYSADAVAEAATIEAQELHHGIWKSTLR